MKAKLVATALAIASLLERLQGILGGRRIFARHLSSLVPNVRLGLVGGDAASGLVGDHRAAIYGEPRRKPWRFNSKLLVGAGAAVALMISFAGAAHSQTVVSTQFVETLVVGSDTFETATGTVLFTTDAVGYSDWLSPIIAGDLAGDSALPIQVRSTASLIPEVSEYQFLSEQGPNYIVLGGGPALAFATYLPSLPAALGADLEAAGGPGYSLVSETVSFVTEQSYSTGAFEPNGDLLDGKATFDVYDVSLVEKPVSAVPEPSAGAMMLIGVGMLGGYLRMARRKDATAMTSAQAIVQHQLERSPPGGFSRFRPLLHHAEKQTWARIAWGREPPGRHAGRMSAPAFRLPKAAIPHSGPIVPEF
jgi:PEP-CTERM motif